MVVSGKVWLVRRRWRWLVGSEVAQWPYTRVREATGRQGREHQLVLKSVLQLSLSETFVLSSSDFPS